jgi:hypothetical protein
VPGERRCRGLLGGRAGHLPHFHPRSHAEHRVDAASRACSSGEICGPASAACSALAAAISRPADGGLAWVLTGRFVGCLTECHLAGVSVPWHFFRFRAFCVVACSATCLRLGCPGSVRRRASAVRGRGRDQSGCPSRPSTPR